jgi:uncharacterized damage-inducible protein DinB
VETHLHGDSEEPFDRTKKEKGETKMIPKMISKVEPMLKEFREEAATTRRVLDKVPADKLSWRPHQKSMSLGQLAMHIATVPGGISKALQGDEFEIDPKNFGTKEPGSVQEIYAAHDQSVRDAEAFLSGVTEQSAGANWRLKVNGKQVVGRPRMEVVRSIMMNHWYHHRGQLSVYLRLLEVPVPSIYGPSADENPFM